MFWKQCIFMCLWILLRARAIHSAPCFPDQWEGSIEIVGAQMDASSQYFTQGRVDVAFDLINERKASNETFDMNGAKFRIQIIMDYGKNIAYEIKDGVCTKTAITQPMSQNCVPDGAISTGSFYLGVEGRAIPVSGYRYNISAGTWEFMYLSPPLTETTPWVPVAEIRQTGISGATAMSTSSYTNVTLGIRDASVFDPPPQCQHILVLPQHKQTFLHSATSKKIVSSSLFFNTQL